MNWKTAFLTVVLLAAFSLFADDTDKRADELETVTLKTPGSVVKRSYSIRKGHPYAVSALVSSTQNEIAWFEVRLYDGAKQVDFFRSLRSSTNECRLDVVFNSGAADRAEVTFALIPDAMQPCSAVFKQYRFVRCEDTIVQPWSRRGGNRCRREINSKGEIILHPNGGKRNTGGTMTIIQQLLPGKKITFSADVEAKLPKAAMLVVHLSGSPDSKNKTFRSAWNNRQKERLSVDFETSNFSRATLELRCATGNKFKKHPVKFSNIQVTPVQ